MKRILQIMLGLILIGAAFSFVGIASGDGVDVPDAAPRANNRVVLIEEFTADWCGPCASMRPAVEQVAQDYGKSQVALLEYHVWDSGNGLDNAKTNQRDDDYSVGGIPDVWIDGTTNIHGSYGSVSANKAAIETEVDARLPVNAPLTIDSTVSLSSSTIVMDATIDATGTVSQTNLNARLVIYEMGVSDGGSIYDYVVRDFEVQSISNSGFPHNLQKQFSVQSGWTFTEIEAVVFVQVGNNGEVLQADNSEIIVNQAPTTKGGAATSLSFSEDTVDTTLDLDNIFEDPEDDPMTYSYLGNQHITVEIAGDGTVTLTPEENWNGAESITFKADDGELFGQHAIVMNVQPVNDAPVVDSQYSNAITITVLEDQSISNVLDLNDVFADVDGDTLSFVVTGNVNVGITISSGDVSISPASDWTGTEVVTFTAKDTDQASAVKDVSITVTDQNDAPRIVNALVDFSMDEDTANTDIDLNQVFNDPENSPLIFTVSGNDHLGVEIGSTGVVTLTPEENWNGAEALTFTASDGPSSATDDVTVTVEPVNDPPTLIGIDDELFEDTLTLTVKEDVTYNGEILAEDIDEDDLEFSISGDSLPASLEVEEDSGDISIKPTNDDVGSYQVTITVEDEEGDDTTETFTLVVENVNDPPVAVIGEPLDGASFTIGDLVQLSAEGSSDIDVDDVLSYSWSSDIEGTLGSVEALLATFSTAGDHTITLTIIDQGSLKSSASVMIKILGDDTTDDDVGPGGSGAPDGSSDSSTTDVDEKSSEDTPWDMGTVGGMPAAYILITVIIIVVVLVLLIVMFLMKKPPEQPTQLTPYQGGVQAYDAPTTMDQQPGTPGATPPPTYGPGPNEGVQTPNYKNDEYSAWNSVSNGFRE